MCKVRGKESTNRHDFILNNNTKHKDKIRPEWDSVFDNSVYSAQISSKINNKTNQLITNL